MSQVLTPTELIPDGSGLDLTAQLAAPTQAVLQFENTGHEVLVVLPGATSETVTVDVGTLVLGQPVSNFAAAALTSGHVEVFGPFHSVIEQPGGDLVQVTLSTTTAITVGLIRIPGVY